LTARSSELARAGYDAAWLAARPAALGRTVRNLHARMAPLGLWEFVTEEWDTEPGELCFRCADVDGLKRRLAELGFARGRVWIPGRWERFERRPSLALHFKHFPGWEDHHVEAHLDPVGAATSPWWWLFPPVPLLLLWRHARDAGGHRDVDRIHALLAAEGFDV
jgi:hypothetical protein